MFVAIHSAVKNSTTVHAAGCSRVTSRRRTTEIHETLDHVFVEGAVKYLKEDGGDRAITVCKCAKGAR